MVQVAPLHNLCMKRLMPWNMAGRHSVSWLCDYVGCCCDVLTAEVLQCGGTLAYVMWLPLQYGCNAVNETLNPNTKKPHAKSMKKMWCPMLGDISRISQKAMLFKVVWKMCCYYLGTLLDVAACNAVRIVLNMCCWKARGIALINTNIGEVKHKAHCRKLQYAVKGAHCCALLSFTPR